MPVPKAAMHLDSHAVSRQDNVWTPRKAGPFFDTPIGQELIGAAIAALITTVLGFETTDIYADYRGVDAIMKSKKAGFMVLEAKG